MSGEDGGPTLREAARHGHLAMINYLVRQGEGGCDVHADHEAALRGAAAEGQLDAVVRLIRLGADPHAMQVGRCGCPPPSPAPTGCPCGCWPGLVYVGQATACSPSHSTLLIYDVTLFIYKEGRRLTLGPGKKVS